MREEERREGQLRLASESIAGLRPYQEDAVLLETLPNGRTVAAVADGMGGHAAGEVASALALETLVGALRDGASLAEAFRRANAEVHAQARVPGRHGMGTTLVGVLVGDAEYEVANVGDSRGYVVSGDGIRRLTEDHSWVAEAIRRGHSEEEAMKSQWRDALTRSVGTDPAVDVDVFGPFPLEPGSTLLLCSDGLYKTLRDADIRELLQSAGSPEAAAHALVAAALERGSDDNITVALVAVGGAPGGLPEASGEAREGAPEQAPEGAPEQAPEQALEQAPEEPTTAARPAEPADEPEPEGSPGGEDSDSDRPPGPGGAGGTTIIVIAALVAITVLAIAFLAGR